VKGEKKKRKKIHGWTLAIKSKKQQQQKLKPHYSDSPPLVGAS
jgi:hypothetical protein